MVQAEGSSPGGDIYQFFSAFIFISVLLGLMDFSDILILCIIRWRSISMRARPAFLQFDWSKAGLSMDLPVFVYSHTKTGFKFFQDREDIESFMCLELCLEIFDFKPRRENLTLKSVKVY